MKIEVGKTYKTAAGDKVEIVGKVAGLAGAAYPFIGVVLTDDIGTVGAWREDGGANAALGARYELAAEHREPYEIWAVIATRPNNTDYLHSYGSEVAMKTTAEMLNKPASPGYSYRAMRLREVTP